MVDTLCKTIDNNQLIGFPNLTSKLVRKYLPDSTTTAKGHMNRTKCGLRSTTKSQTSKADEIEKYFRLDPNEGLWYIPISINGEAFAIQDCGQQLNSAYHTSTMLETIKFIHGCLFSPTVDTLCKEIDNYQLIGFPNLTLKLV